MPVTFSRGAARPAPFPPPMQQYAAAPVEVTPLGAKVPGDAIDGWGADTIQTGTVVPCGIAVIASPGYGWSGRVVEITYGSRLDNLDANVTIGANFASAARAGQILWVTGEFVFPTLPYPGAGDIRKLFYVKGVDGGGLIRCWFIPTLGQPWLSCDGGSAVAGALSNTGLCRFQAGKMYRLEARIIVNSQDGLADGRVTMWVNGIQIHDRSNYSFGWPAPDVAGFTKVEVGDQLQGRFTPGVTPDVFTGTAQAGGALAAGTYYCIVTVETPAGEVYRSAEIATVATLNQAIAYSVTRIQGDLTYRFYLGTVSGGQAGCLVVSPTLATGSTIGVTYTGQALTARARPVAYSEKRYWKNLYAANYRTSITPAADAARAYQITLAQGSYDWQSGSVAGVRQWSTYYGVDVPLALTMGRGRGTRGAAILCDNAGGRPVSGRTLVATSSNPAAATMRTVANANGEFLLIQPVPGGTQRTTNVQVTADDGASAVLAVTVPAQATVIVDHTPTGGPSANPALGITTGGALTKRQGGAGVDLAITVANRLYVTGDSTGTPVLYDYGNLPGGADYNAEIALTFVSMADSRASVIVHFNPVSLNGYRAYWSATDGWQIWKVTGGVDVGPFLYSEAAIIAAAVSTYSAGQTVQVLLETVVIGTTVYLTLWVDGVIVLQTSDSTAAYTAAGSVGIMYSGPCSATTGQHIGAVSAN